MSRKIIFFRRINCTVVVYNFEKVKKEKTSSWDCVLANSYGVNISYDLASNNYYK